jgi:hypothetical protein
MKTFSPSQLSALMLAQNGHKELKTAAVHTCPEGETWVGLVVDEDCTFSAETNIEGSDDLSSRARTAGQTFFGDFKTVTITVAGAVLAIRG